MKRLYRVHKSTNVLFGMYTSRTSGYMFDNDRHPSPGDDAPLWQAIQIDGREWSEFYFGFASIEQFEFWVYKQEWWEELHKEGYVISVFETDAADFKEGRTQAVMHRAALQTGLKLTVSFEEYIAKGKEAFSDYNS